MKLNSSPYLWQFVDPTLSFIGSLIQFEISIKLTWFLLVLFFILLPLGFIHFADNTTYRTQDEHGNPIDVKKCGQHDCPVKEHLNSIRNFNTSIANAETVKDLSNTYQINGVFANYKNNISRFFYNGHDPSLPLYAESVNAIVRSRAMHDNYDSGTDLKNSSNRSGCCADSLVTHSLMLNREGTANQKIADTKLNILTNNACVWRGGGGSSGGNSPSSPGNHS